MRKLFLVSTMFLGLALSVSAQKTDSTKTVKITLRDTNPLSIKEPLIIIDGNKQFVRGLSSINGLDPNLIESVTVLKDSSATAIYGIDGMAGVVIIKTKEDKGAVKASIPLTIPSSKIEVKDVGMGLKKQNTAILFMDDSKRLLDFGDSLSNTKLKPLYIIDGKEVADSDFKKLKQEDIESIEILKDESSKSLYGEKANNGVIIVRTKKERATPKKN